LWLQNATLRALRVLSPFEYFEKKRGGPF
jgi:hypothetical protein